MTPKQTRAAIKTHKRKAAMFHYLSSKNYWWYLRNWWCVNFVFLVLGWWCAPRVNSLMKPVYEFLSIISGYSAENTAVGVISVFWLIFTLWNLGNIGGTIWWASEIFDHRRDPKETLADVANDYEECVKELESELLKGARGGPVSKPSHGYDH